VLREILSRTGAKDGDLVFFGADKAKVVNDALGALRAKVGHDAASRKDAGSRCGSWTSRCSSRTTRPARGPRATIPFTAPKDGHEERFVSDPGNAIAKAYDVVLNGWEIGGGSVRIHRPDVQAKVFEALRISPEDQRRKFGFLLDALSYGAPPTAGSRSASTAWRR
jgi:aspartyl-tRNA synthetase